jgi:hypothetical protein
MIITIALIVSILVALNFALLLFSCNKYPKERYNIPPAPLKTKAKPLRKENQTATELLATGS